MSERELARRRRCRALQLGLVLGVLLPIFQPSWITLGAAVVGISILAFVYRRECRHEEKGNSAR